jgi:hypothetical protein
VDESVHGKTRLLLGAAEVFLPAKVLSFRALIVPDKAKLKHEAFEQNHDTWYYKMCFEMLKVLFNPQDRYRIFFDIKDTKSGERVKKLHQVMCNNAYDFQRKIIEKMQTIRSHEAEQAQLADLLIGCVLAANRNLEVNPAKKALVETLRKLSGYCLTRTNLIREKKLNLFRWSPSETHPG